MPEAVVDHLKNLIPLGRMGEPEGLSHPRCGEDVVGWSAARTTIWNTHFRFYKRPLRTF
jgi:hypothetical protein